MTLKGITDIMTAKEAREITEFKRRMNVDRLLQIVQYNIKEAVKREHFQHKFNFPPNVSNTDINALIKELKDKGYEVVDSRNDKVAPYLLIKW